MKLAEGPRVYNVEDKKLGLGFEGLLKDVPSTMEYTGYVLSVTFAGQGFPLPILTVNPKEPKDKHISIAYFNPLRKDMALAAASDMTDLTLSLGIEAGRPVLFFGPPTSKSKLLTQYLNDGFKEKTSRNERKSTWRMFSGGVREDWSKHDLVLTDSETGVFRAIQDPEAEVFGVFYRPVTGKDKFLYLDTFEIDLVKNFVFQQEGQIIIAEDVVTTMATVKAMKRVLTDFVGVKAENIYTITAAFEGNKPCSDPTVRHVIQLPEWEGVF